MKYEERKPPKELEPYVKCFWLLHREYDERDDEEVLWPDGCIEMIFHFGASYQVKGKPMETSFLIGTLTHYHIIKAMGTIKLFGIRLKPWGLKYFKDLNVKELKDGFIALKDVFRSDKVNQLEQKLAHASFEEGLPHLESFLLKGLSHNELDPVFLSTLEEIYEDPKGTDIQSVVEKSHYSKRQYERKCSDWTGLTPKKLSKVARFNQVRLRIFFDPDVDLHDCMYEFGYFDYAHFSKEFKESLGLTPKEYQRWILDKANKPKEDVVFLHDEPE
ncbi:helix-turn-helix domain-containing protein [Pseudalkalibacillus sp. SCS-8]|uniref:AraC family transcriptional regulator n=1 Tax=Pseudalkalibacillus nanhaiensis TaxID=3115291 RepID=UPI0032DB0F14